MDALQSVVEGFVPLFLCHRHLAGRHIDSTGIVEHHLGTVNADQRFLNARLRGDDVLMSLHEADASFHGQHRGIVYGFFGLNGFEECQHLVDSLQCLVVVALVEVNAHKSFLGKCHHQRVARCRALFYSFQVVTLRLGTVAHLSVEFADIIVTDGLTLQPVVFLENGQRLLVVVNGQVGLVLHVVDVGDSTIDEGAHVVDVLLGVALV